MSLTNTSSSTPTVACSPSWREIPRGGPATGDNTWMPFSDNFIADEETITIGGAYAQSEFEAEDVDLVDYFESPRCSKRAVLRMRR